MKLFIQPCDAENRIDGTIANALLAHLPGVVTSLAQADLVIVPVSLLSDFRINPDLLRINKPVCLIEMLEYGLGWDQKTTHLLGRTPDAITCLKEPDWKLLDDFFAARPPALYLKRELLEAQRAERVQPVEWPCYLEPHPVVSKQEYDSRPIEVFHCWGYSSKYRPILHAEIFKAMATHSLGVVSGWDEFSGYFQNPCHRTWAALFQPHYVRKPIADVLWFHQRSKIVVSLPGAGNKCFRSLEAPLGSLMAMHSEEFAWSYKWEHGVNCMRIRPDFEFEDLWEMSSQDWLYDAYVGSQEMVAKYSTKRYISEYIVPLLKRSL